MYIPGQFLFALHHLAEHNSEHAKTWTFQNSSHQEIAKKTKSPLSLLLGPPRPSLCAMLGLLSSLALLANFFVTPVEQHALLQYHPHWVGTSPAARLWTNWRLWRGQSTTPCHSFPRKMIDALEAWDKRKNDAPCAPKGAHVGQWYIFH